MHPVSWHPHNEQNEKHVDSKPAVRLYRHNPYDFHCSETTLADLDATICQQDEARVATEPMLNIFRPGETLSVAVLHGALASRVSFVPYPAEGFEKPQPVLRRDEMTRVFLGQLPYLVTDMQLDWLCATFAGAFVYFPERITKFDTQRGAKVPTGCIHAYCDPRDAAKILTGLHKRLLIDDSGVWMADSAEELEHLNTYCHAMKVDRKRRFQNRPYDTVVAQVATSHYVPPHLAGDRRM